MNQENPIAIIGGGLTGLVAALRLSESGHPVTVYESGNQLGGLAASFEIAGEPIERAYHHLFHTDADILSLIAELGLNDRLEWKESSIAIYRDGKTWPFMSPVDVLKFGPSSFIGRIRLGLAVMRIKHLKRWESLVGIPALDWMTRACGKSATAAVWEPLLRGKFANHAATVSMGWLWARLHIRANSREPGGGKEKLGYVRGGFIEIFNALEKRLLARGVKIFTNARVSQIERTETGVSITSEAGSGEYAAALFTGSNSALERLLPPTPAFEDYKRELRQVDYLGAICLVFETEQKLGEYYWTNINEADSPFIVFIRHTRLLPAERYGNKEVYYLGAYVSNTGRRFNLDEETLKSEWFAYVKKMYPHFQPSQVTGTHFFRFRDAQHVVDTGYAKKILPSETPLKGLFLANFTQIFPEDRGTNFAVQEGEKIAKKIAEHSF